ncbi:MAG TPA: glycosyltransferase [Actinomycetospora sp.]|uniref:glycosyltransferase family 2 protein n=1 Tax=Actinomycetospora sp. TaxID=1872135 RepID=UPI002F3F7C3B
MSAIGTFASARLRAGTMNGGGAASAAPAGTGVLWNELSVADLPVARAELELASSTGTLELLGAGDGASKVMTLVRLHSAPLGVVFLDGRRGLSRRAHVGTIWSALGDAINRHLASDGLDRLVRAEDLVQPLPDGLTRCQDRRRTVLAQAPCVSVVVATRERHESLRRCLSSLLASEYPRFEVIVVDNDPATAATAEMVEHSFPGQIRYLRESRRGLGAAHNRGVAEASGTIIAFVDDDVVVDRHWLAALAEGFAVTGDVGCVTGLILPAQLDTPAQVLLERHGGFGKGFDLQIFDRRGHRPADPLFPFRSGRFGSGANMAFDASLLRRLGGFDPAIGTGTFARGGDDLTAFFRVLVAGSRLVYQPGALVWHRHHRDLASLGNQAYGYGVGFGAYLASAIAHEPAMLPALLRRVPGGVAFAARRSSASNADRYQDWPSEFVGLERRGMIFGPFAYLVSRWRARGAARPSEVAA